MSGPRDRQGGGESGAHSESAESTFLSRWSERKAAAAREPVEPSAADPAAAIASTDEATPAPVLRDEDMPAVETLDEHSEYAGFLSPGVSEELRKLALRKLFRLPSFHVRDGLDDYDEDFTRFAALGDVMTQDLRHRLETAAKRRGEREEEMLASAETDAEKPAAEDDQSEVAVSDPPADLDDTGVEAAEGEDSAPEDRQLG